MREKLNMNYGWKFHLGEIPFDIVNGHFDSYMHSKAQSGRNAASELFYDDDFEMVDLPHDYVIEQVPLEGNNNSQGCYYRDNAWYRRHFQLEKEDENKRIVLLFDGAGKNTEVWVNGHPAGSNESMYNSFYIDITPYLHFGDEDNVISVHISNNGDVEGWWYEGAGLYRDVWMIKTSSIATDVWGLRMSPTKEGNDTWNVKIDSSIYSMEEQEEVNIEYILKDSSGKEVQRIQTIKDVRFGENEFSINMKVQNPSLWDLESCTLYKIEAQIRRKEELLDVNEAKFGFREICFDADRGFLLNGNKVKLRGVCIHQDHARLGVAVPKSIVEYRLSKLKSIGVNAYRCAHNNPDPDVLDLCDKMGILVIDENRKFNFSDQTKKQVQSMCYRDMNHPSVIVWSVGNEEPLQNTKTGKALVRQLKRYVHSIDPLRPVTVALNGGFYDSYVAGESDIVAVNYRINDYDSMHEVHKGKCIVATESGASGNGRGIYFSKTLQKGKGHYSTSYDEARSEFGSAYIDAIRQSETHDFIAGTFLWAGIDYRGEEIWPMTTCSSGMFDNCCFEKDNAYMVKSIWKDEPMVHVMPSWNLKGHEGEKIRVVVYTNLKEVEVFVNGCSQGRKGAEKYKAVEYEVTYEPGCIKAVGYGDNGITVVDEHHTAGDAYELNANIMNNPTNNGEDDLVVEIDFTDKNGYVLTDASEAIECIVEEGGNLVSLDSGDPKDTSSSLAKIRKMFSGKLQAIIRVNEGSDNVKVTFKCIDNGLTKVINYTPKNVERIPRLSACKGYLEIKSFRKWPDTKNEDAINLEYNFHDMNTSEPIDIKNYHGVNSCGYEIFTGTTIVPKVTDGKQIYLQWKGISGDVKIRVFHDTQCWPNPTPEVFMDLQERVESDKKIDYLFKLDGFGGKEKVKIIMQVKNDGKFALDNVVYIVK